MRNILGLLAALALSSAAVYAQVNPLSGTIYNTPAKMVATYQLNSTTQVSDVISLERYPITQHELVWQTDGTVSAGACALQGSASASFASPTTIIAAQTVTSSGGGPTLLTTQIANFVRVNCTTAIVGTGTVNMVYVGFPDNPVGATFSGTISVGNVNVHDGSGNAINSTTGSLNVHPDSGGATDEATFTAGSSSAQTTGGFYQTTATSNALTTGQSGAFQVTANRALFVNVRNASGTEVGTSGNPFSVSCSTCSGVSATDEAAFTAGTSGFAAGGGFFQTTATSNALTTGQQGMFQVTAQRALFSNLRNASGTEVGTASTPLQVSLANTGANGTNLNITCSNCSGSGVSATDEATFTAGTSLFAPGGGFYQTTATGNALTAGQQGAFQVTAQRALFTNLRNSSGTEIATAAAPLQVSLANTASNSSNILVTVAAITAAGTGPLAGSGSDSVYATGGDTLATTQVSVTSSATQVIAARTARRGVSVTNLGTTALYCGPSNSVTTSNGDILLGVAGASNYYTTNSAVYCVSGGSSQSVSVAEIY